MPSWLPLEVSIANTLVVEAAVAFAIYWFIVRRAEDRRRARFRFVIGALLVASAEGLGALDVLAAPTMHERVLSRGPLNATFCWETSVVLGRMSGDRSVALFRAPCHGASSVFVVKGHSLTDEIWALHEQPDTEESAAKLVAAVKRSPAIGVLPADLAAIVSSHR
ncbi:MAG: hypothetical protein ACAI25_07010 [Planctomycetota bacterium]